MFQHLKISNFFNSFTHTQLYSTFVIFTFMIAERALCMDPYVHPVTDNAEASLRNRTYNYTLPTV
jgi:hypothetical protein